MPRGETLDGFCNACPLLINVACRFVVSCALGSPKDLEVFPCRVFC